MTYGMEIQQGFNGLYELALFAGAGGGILGGTLLGWRCIGAVEIEGYPSGILGLRQNDGCLCPFPIWDDVRTFRSDNPECAKFFALLKRISHRLVISGGFPCQDISVGGPGCGIDGERSGLWREMARIIREIGPAFAWVENSPALVVRGLGSVLRDLAEMGMDARWGVLGVGDAGGLHERNRIWIAAYPDNREKRIQRFKPKEVSRQPGFSWCQNVRRLEDLRDRPDLYESTLCRSPNEFPAYVDRIAAIGNAQNPAVVRLAFETILSGL